MSMTWLDCLIPSLFWIFLSMTIKSGKVDCCPDGKYGVALSSGGIICKNCTTFPKCPDGMGMSMLLQCGNIIDEHADLHCVHCIPGKSFSSHFDSAMCQPCQNMSCHVNEAIDGKCTPSGDTTICAGICKRGYYSGSGQLDDCEPCSLCKGPHARRNQKCIDDKEPRERQCEVHMGLPSTTIATEQDGVVTKGKENKNEQSRTSQNDGKYNLLGHPGIFSSLLVVIAILGACLLFILQNKYCKRMRTSQSTNTVAVYSVPNGETDTGGSVEFVDENENDSVPADLPASMLVQISKRKNSGKRKVSFNRQISNPASERDKEREGLIGSSNVSDCDDEPDVFDEDPIAMSVRKRSLSSSSSTSKKGPRLSLSRQNSNPGSETQNEESNIRRSKTFSSFSSIISGQKGTAEETKPILSRDDDSEDDTPPVVSININTPIQEHCQDILTKKPSKLNASVYTNVCAKLNQEIDGKDWKALAGLMGYTNEFVKNLKCKNDPAEALLSHWETKSGHDVKNLIGLLEKIERGDIIDILQQRTP